MHIRKSRGGNGIFGQGSIMAASFAALSANSFPGIPMCAGTQSRVMFSRFRSWSIISDANGCIFLLCGLVNVRMADKESIHITALLMFSSSMTHKANFTAYSSDNITEKLDGKEKRMITPKFLTTAQPVLEIDLEASV